MGTRSGWLRGGLSLLSLRETMALARGWRYRLVGIVVGVAYFLASSIEGLMFEPHLWNVPLSIVYLPPSPYVQGNWWDYPGLIIQGGWGVLGLPFLPTITMVFVSFAVGLSGTVLVHTAAIWFRQRSGRRSVLQGALAAATPSATGFATLGACCCTSCASVAGASVVAAASGTTLTNLLVNGWYMSVFELVILSVSLVAQEAALRRSHHYVVVRPVPVDRRLLASLALRGALLVAGLTWSVAMIVEWSTIPPQTASAFIWYHWIFEHQLLSAVALGAALFPRPFVEAWRWLGRGSAGATLVRIALGVAAVTWLFWVPPILVSHGLGGLVNEVFGYLGLPSSWGAVPPDAVGTAALAFHWTFQHGLLGAFALVSAIRPRAVLVPLLWSLPVEAPLEWGAVAPDLDGMESSQPTPTSAVAPLAPTALEDRSENGAAGSPPTAL